MKKHDLIGVSSNFSGYSQIIDLYHRFKNWEYGEIDLSIQEWFDANLCSALGSVLDELSEDFKIIRISAEGRTREILQKNSFLSHYGYPSIEDQYHTTLRYIKLKPSETRFFSIYIITTLLNRPELPTMSRALTKKIYESIFEIFANAQIHSESDFIYVCGQFYPQKHKLIITIADSGIGFKNKINRKFQSNLTAVQAIRWAIQDGHSTKTDIPGGIGLAILKDFITLNKGMLQIVSNEGFYQKDEQSEFFSYFPDPFPGTVVTVEFRTDDPRSYSLASEKNERG